MTDKTLIVDWNAVREDGTVAAIVPTDSLILTGDRVIADDMEGTKRVARVKALLAILEIE